MDSTHKNMMISAYVIHMVVVVVGVSTPKDNEFLMTLNLGLMILGLILAYVVRVKATDEDIYHHSIYYTRSFWVYFIGTVVLLMVTVGLILLFFAAKPSMMLYATITGVGLSFTLTIWFVYRMIKGCVYLWREQGIDFQSWK